MRRLVTAKTRAIYVNSPSNPTGGVLTRKDLEAIAALARERNLWIISDEAYEDVVFDGQTHIEHRVAAGHVRTDDSAVHVQQDVRDYRPAAWVHRGERSRRSAIASRKMLFYTVSNTSSTDPVRWRRRTRLDRRTVDRRLSATSCAARRDLFYAGVADAAAGVFSGEPPAGAFYAFLKIDPAGARRCPTRPSRSPGR